MNRNKTEKKRCVNLIRKDKQKVLTLYDYDVVLNF